MSALFTPFQLKDVTLRNRIAIPPMCQYQAHDGYVNEWHLTHYASMARGGASLVIVEATGVSPEGRITPGCTGLWEDSQIEGMARIASAIKAAGAVPGIQIGHAGRKASANKPWEGDDHIANGDRRGWPTLAPSAIAFGGGLSKVPQEMTLGEIDKVKADFVAAAKRALAAGFQWLELHFAHGYLAQSFFSPIANQRTDHYGGNAENRGRFLLETLAAVRTVWPEQLPLTARFGVVEYDGHDNSFYPEAVDLVRKMRGEGLDLIDASIGFSTLNGKTPWGPGFFVPVAGRVKQDTQMPVAASWCIDDAQMAEKAVSEGHMDLVLIARAHLANPHYVYQMAMALGEPQPAQVLPKSYGYWLSRYRGPGKGAAQ
ncbi:NADH:flavin oxidoreductase/NADH oxidase [Comamonas terrigena]|uniref:NADH:flavin oxidoreductase/NADH oxidase n=1 Tax=Comamonas terrigena TaxID=32013 RepID=UPI00244C9990|nr:NADH:flavin oxidoreductase/NADH oxidase [Comamonas terrigena]MDH1701866.1 NADH:flavin oxidoreductase/NADH oxidase [Comamonas terrigena]